MSTAPVRNDPRNDRMNGLSEYFDWAHRRADRTHRNIRLALLAVALAIVGCTPAPPKPIAADEKVLAPIAAINVSQCDGSVALYVIVDSTHMVRFDQKQTTLFTFDHGQMSETDGPPTPYKNALELASSAGITSHVDVKCPGVST